MLKLNVSNKEIDFELGYPITKPIFDEVDHRIIVVRVDSLRLLDTFLDILFMQLGEENIASKDTFLIKKYHATDIIPSHSMREANKNKTYKSFISTSLPMFQSVEDMQNKIADPSNLYHTNIFIDTTLLEDPSIEEKGSSNIIPDMNSIEFGLYDTGCYISYGSHRSALKLI